MISGVSSPDLKNYFIYLFFFELQTLSRFEGTSGFILAAVWVFSIFWLEPLTLPTNLVGLVNFVLKRQAR